MLSGISFLGGKVTFVLYLFCAYQSFFDEIFIDAQAKRKRPVKKTLEDYRYGYQGQEKTQDDGTWDQFELRNLNHDLGRWTSPDPYGQFNSPYISMGNNPIKYTDPNGGYINMSNEGVAQRNSFMRQQAQDRFNQQGRYSYEFLYPRYQDALQDLMRSYGVGNGTNSEMGEGAQNEPAFMKALYQLNNDYLGLGLAATVLSSGQSLVTSNSIINNQGLFLDLQDQNGTTGMMNGIQSELYNLRHVDYQKQGDDNFVSVNNQRQRDYIGAWHEQKWAAIDKADAAKRAADKAFKEKLRGPTDLYASLSGGLGRYTGGIGQYTQPGKIDMNTASGELVVATFIAAYQYAFTHCKGGTFKEITSYFENNGGGIFSYKNISFEHKGMMIHMKEFEINFSNSEGLTPAYPEIVKPLNESLDARDQQYGGWYKKKFQGVDVSRYFNEIEYGVRIEYVSP